MWLSLLIPSKRPDDLDKFLHSLYKNTSDLNGLEFCINENPYDGKVGDLFYECYKISRTDWIFICNDDLVCETKDWDVRLKERIYYDGHCNPACLWYPNDTMFRKKHACFPIVSRKILEVTNYWKVLPPFKRYKIDDVLFDIFPEENRIYMEDIVFKHTNDKGEYGYEVGDGRIYPNDKDILAHDTKLYDDMLSVRKGMRRIVEGL